MGFRTAYHQGGLAVWFPVAFRIFAESAILQRRAPFHISMFSNENQYHAFDRKRSVAGQ